MTEMRRKRAKEIRILKKSRLILLTNNERVSCSSGLGFTPLTAATPAASNYDRVNSDSTHQH